MDSRNKKAAKIAYQGVAKTILKPAFKVVEGATRLGKRLDKRFGTENMTAFTLQKKSKGK